MKTSISYLSTTDRIKQKVSNDTENLNAIYHLTLLDTYRTRRPVTAEYALFSSVHRTCTTTDHVLGPKTNFNKLQRIQDRDPDLDTPPRNYQKLKTKRKSCSLTTRN